MKKIHIFKTGTHTDSNGVSVSFSESDLQKAISAYDPTLHQAPIVVGHPTTDAPAYGWVKSLTGEHGNLYAVPEQIQHDFGEQVKQGLYKKVSASFYPPNSPNNPVKGVYYLRHVGFLGAEPPAVKGLEPIEFSEHDTAVLLTFDFNEQVGSLETNNGLEQTLFDKFVSALGALLFSEQAQTAMPNVATVPNNPITKPNQAQDNPMTDNTQTPPNQPATPDPKDVEIANLKAELAKKEVEQAQAQITAAEAANNDFAENLVKNGKLTPAHKDMMVAVLNAIDTVDRATPLNFGEGDKVKSLSQAFKDSLDEGLLAKSHLFGESATKTHKTSVNFDHNLPASVQVDSDSMAKHQEILAYCEAHKVDYTTAVMAIGN